MKIREEVVELVNGKTFNSSIELLNLTLTSEALIDARRECGQEYWGVSGPIPNNPIFQGDILIGWDRFDVVCKVYVQDDRILLLGDYINYIQQVYGKITDIAVLRRI